MGLVLDVDNRKPWVVWTERGGAPGEPVYASNGEETVYLGESGGLVLSTCGGYVYWDTTLRPTEHGEDYEFDYARWRPGGPVEILWTVHPDDWPILFNSCSDGILTAVFKDVTTGVATVRYLEPPDRWLAAVDRTTRGSGTGQ